jgi:hypothetical protein
MINNKHIYLVATYMQKPKNPKMTHIKGYMKDPENIRWDEAFTVTRGVKKRDAHAQIQLDLTAKTVERDSFASGKTFDEIFHYFFLNYHKQLVPVMAQIDPEYLAVVASKIESDMKAATGEPEVKDAEVVGEAVQAS